MLCFVRGNQMKSFFTSITQWHQEKNAAPKICLRKLLEDWKARIVFFRQRKNALKNLRELSPFKCRIVQMMVNIKSGSTRSASANINLKPPSI